jgi:hypothetical protein
VASRGCFGWGSQRPEGDATGVDHRRALEALLAAIYRAFTCLLSSAWGLRYAAIDGHVREFQSDSPVVGFARYLLQSVHHSCLYPLVASASESGGRARPIGDPPVGATEDQNLHQLLEDHPVGDARPVTAERMVDLALGQEGTKLLPENRLLWMYGWIAGTGAPSRREAWTTPRMIEHPVPALQANARRPYWRGLLLGSSELVTSPYPCTERAPN